MLRSLYAAILGLRNHQTRMDVIGNNIANVNTIGYKSSRVTFEESLSQMLSGATRAVDKGGGTNPMQVGLGMNIGSIDSRMSQGNLESTGLILQRPHPQHVIDALGKRLDMTVQHRDVGLHAELMREAMNR